MSKKKKEIPSQDEMFMKVSFKEVPIGSFYYANGYLHLKLNEEDYVRIDPVRSCCDVNEYNKATDSKEIFLCDVTFNYKRVEKKIPENKISP
jgi:hypothetical protein